MYNGIAYSFSQRPVSPNLLFQLLSISHSFRFKVVVKLVTGKQIKIVIDVVCRVTILILFIDHILTYSSVHSLYAAAN